MKKMSNIVCTKTMSNILFNLIFMFHTENFVSKEHFLYFSGKVAKNNEVHRAFLGCVTASMQLF